MVKHMWFWLVMSLIAVFIIPAVVSPTTYKARLHHEVTALESALGQEAAAKIMEMTDSYYKSAFDDSGFRSWVMEHYYIGDDEIIQGRTEGGIPVGAAAQFSQNYALSLFFNLYELTFRLTQGAIWAILTLPFMLAAILDGAMQRQAKIISFSYSSPSVYNASWHFIIAFVFCGFFYLNTPLSVPPIAFPIGVGVFSFALRSLVANLQRSA